MRLYHYTSEAPRIGALVFTDSDRLGVGSDTVGVRLFNVPVDINEGIPEEWFGFSIEIPEDVVRPYEVFDESAPPGHELREFLVPAEVANQYGPPTPYGSDAADLFDAE